MNLEFIYFSVTPHIAQE